jgi:hypothetical protein
MGRSTNEGQIEFQRLLMKSGRLKEKAVIEATNFNSSTG